MGLSHALGVEPNPYMHAELRQAGAARGLAAEFRTVTAEGMAVEDASVDPGCTDEWWETEECCEEFGGTWFDGACGIPGPFVPPSMRA